jgi:peptidyl-prolyl cis-trans isomerase SurA
LTKHSVALLAALLLLTAVSDRVAEGQIIERVLVRVNGEILTQTQLTQKQIQALRDRNQEITDLRSLQDDARLKAELAALTPRVLVDAVDELLLVQRGRELKLRFTDELFKQAMDNLKTRNNFKSDEELTKALAQEGLTIEQLRQDFERAYLVQAVQQREIGQKMNLTDEERRQYYNTHRETFVSPATITLREIFIAFPVGVEIKGTLPPVTPAEEAVVKERIDAVRARAVAGEDFAALVAEVSTAATKANGGLVGPVRIDDINPALAGVINSLKPGDVSPPVRSPRGYQLFKLESRAEPAPQPYEQVREQIQQRIYEDRLEGETQRLLERLRSQAVIEWKDESYRQLYAKALGEATSARAAQP